jgi:hypothetical protein
MVLYKVENMDATSLRGASMANSYPYRVLGPSLLGDEEPSTGEGLFEGLPRFLTLDEFARIARISRGSAYRLVAAGQVPCKRFGRRLAIPRTALLRDLTPRPGSNRSAR